MRKRDGRNRVHSGGHDRDGRASTKRRHAEEQIDLAAPPTRQTDWLEAQRQAEIEALEGSVEAQLVAQGFGPFDPPT